MNDKLIQQWGEYTKYIKELNEQEDFAKEFSANPMSLPENTKRSFVGFMDYLKKGNSIT